MCEVIKIGESTAIICGGHNDHECDENASVYETKDGQRFYFQNGEDARKWYNENYMHTTMGSVACSVCGCAAIDNAWKLDFLMAGNEKALPKLGILKTKCSI